MAPKGSLHLCNITTSDRRKQPGMRPGDLHWRSASDARLGDDEPNFGLKRAIRSSKAWAVAQIHQRAVEGQIKLDGDFGFRALSDFSHMTSQCLEVSAVYHRKPHGFGLKRLAYAPDVTRVIVGEDRDDGAAMRTVAYQSLVRQ
jgi:hypothetical protein